MIHSIEDGHHAAMRIHLISNLFHPDELAGASLYTDLAYYLRDVGHDVRVTTTFSYYPKWKLRDEDRGVAVREELLDGIPVRRVSMYVPVKPSGKGRMLSDASFLWSLWRRGRFPLFSAASSSRPPSTTFEGEN